jgi:hypothetical protein
LLATRSGSFSFWDDKEEEIYSEQDGTPIKWKRETLFL